MMAGVIEAMRWRNARRYSMPRALGGYYAMLMLMAGGAAMIIIISASKSIAYAPLRFRECQGPGRTELAPRYCH